MRRTDLATSNIAMTLVQTLLVNRHYGSLSPCRMDLSTWRVAGGRL